MGKNGLESKKTSVSRMFPSDENLGVLSDEELALHIYHRFNICRDTLEDMPAFDKHLENLFCKEKEK